MCNMIRSLNLKRNYVATSNELSPFEKTSVDTIKEFFTVSNKQQFQLYFGEFTD